MNNNFFALTRYLRDRGIDAHLLLLNNEISHFHPSQDTFDLDYQEYTHTVSWGDPFSFLDFSGKEIDRDIKDYDYIIACDVVPAFLMKIDRPVNIFVPFGSDLYYYPFMRLVKHPNKQLNYYYCSKNQRIGIQQAEYMSLTPTNNEFKNVIERIKYPGKILNFGVPMIYTPLFNPETIQLFYDRSHWRGEFEKLRNKSDLLIFHHSRHFWKKGNNGFAYKANNYLIEGFARFIRQYPSIKACLIMLEYGPDVQETKKLVKKLNITSYVKWFPLMARKDLMVGINHSDIVAGEFGHSWLVYGVVYEAMAMGKPILHHRQDKYYQDIYPELYPMIHAKNIEDIFYAFQKYANEKEYFQKIGLAGKDWLQKYLIDQTVERYVELILGKSLIGSHKF